MRLLHEQLRDAWQQSEYTLVELIALAELDMTEASLSKKLKGTQILTTSEAEKLARVLKQNLVYVPDQKAEGAA